MPKIGAPVWKTGAYRYRNIVNGKAYVGGAYKDFEQRRKSHRIALIAGTHRNQYFQRAWNKYGEQSFVFEILERCPPDKESVRVCEQRWIDLLDATNDKVGYNISPTAGSNFGLKHTDEAKAKIAEAGRNSSVETRKKRSEYKKAYLASMTPEQKNAWRNHLARIAPVNTGSKRSNETRARMSIVQGAPAARKRMAEIAKSIWEKRRERIAEEVVNLPSPEPAATPKPQVVMFGNATISS